MGSTARRGRAGRLQHWRYLAPRSATASTRLTARTGRVGRGRTSATATDGTATGDGTGPAEPSGAEPSKSKQPGDRGAGVGQDGARSLHAGLRGAAGVGVVHWLLLATPHPDPGGWWWGEGAHVQGWGLDAACGGELQPPVHGAWARPRSRPGRVRALASAHRVSLAR